MRKLNWTGVAMGIIVLGVGCGDGEVGGCEGLCNKLCRLATDCIKDPSQQNDCYFKTATVTQGRNPAGRGCETGMIRDVCGDTTKPPELFTACAAALGDATCGVDDSDDVLLLPDACNGLLECKSGPCLD